MATDFMKRLACLCVAAAIPPDAAIASTSPLPQPGVLHLSIVSLQGSVSIGNGRLCPESKPFGPLDRVVLAACHAPPASPMPKKEDDATILVLPDGQCMAVVADTVQPAACATSDPAQQWTILGKGKTWGELRSKRTQKCLTAHGASGALTMDRCSGISAQQWTLPAQ